MEASEQERQKLVHAAKTGGVRVDPKIADAVERMFNRKPGEDHDWTITQYDLRCWSGWEEVAKDGKTQLGNKGGFGIDWQSQSAGTGRVDFYIDLKTGKIRCMSECCSKEFVKGLLCKMVDDIDWSENI